MRSWSTASAATGSASGIPPSRCSTPTRSSEATDGSPRAARSSSTPASTPAARRRTSSSSASPARRAGSGGATSTPALDEDRFEGLREKVTDYLSARDLYVVDAFAGADPAHRICAPRRHRPPVPRALRAHDVHRPDAGGAARLRAGGARPARARPRGRSRTRTARAASTFVVLHPTRAGGADRRHLLRGRDQEVDLHAHERPPAARRASSRCTARRTSTTRATWRSSSASPAPARRRSRPIPSGA